MQEAGKILILLGLIAVLAGAIIYMGWGTKVFGWLGRLPGDIRIEKNGMAFYLPITTCIVISLFLSGIARIYTWFRAG